MRHISKGAGRVLNKAGRDVSYVIIDDGYDPATRKTSDSRTTLTVRANIRNYKPHEIKGLVEFGDREVRLAASEISFVPKKGDEIIDGNQKLRVASSNPLYAGSVAALYVLIAKGV